MLDEVSNDGLLELSNIMTAHEPKPLAQQRPSRSNLVGILGLSVALRSLDPPL